MTRNEARKIIALHTYHTQERAKARREGDTEGEQIAQVTLERMQSLYNEASRVLSK